MKSNNLIEIPDECPSCGSILERVKDQLFCRNSSCGAVSIKKVVNFAKVLKIKGLGEKTIEKLSISTIYDIYALREDSVVAIIGEKLATKLLVEVGKAKSTTVTRFLSAFSIPLVGNTAASKVQSTDIANLTYDKLKGYGLGDKAATNLVNWIQTEYTEGYDKLPVVLVSEQVETVLDSKFVVCVTGKVPGYTKATITKELNDLGVKVVNSITTKTTHLICNERKGSSKELKAESLDMPIITYDNFKEII